MTWLKKAGELAGGIIGGMFDGESGTSGRCDVEVYPDKVEVKHDRGTVVIRNREQQEKQRLESQSGTSDTETQ